MMKMRLYFVTQEEAVKFYKSIEKQYRPMMKRMRRNHETIWEVSYFAPQA